MSITQYTITQQHICKLTTNRNSEGINYKKKRKRNEGRYTHRIPIAKCSYKISQNRYLEKQYSRNIRLKDFGGHVSIISPISSLSFRNLGMR